MEELLGWGVAIGVAYAAYSLVFGSRSGSSSAGAGRSRVDQAKIDRVLDMFPHLSSRAVRWELERNGASVERAVERALREGGLPEPPASYFPPDPQEFGAAASGTQTPPVQRPTTATGTTHGATSTGGGGAKVPPPSLIKRLGLNNKLGDAVTDDKGKGKEVQGGEGWANSREEREERLRKRKENLVLAARRKMLAKQQSKTLASEAEPLPTSSTVQEL